MKGREALRIIEKRIKEGHSKKEIYEELFGQVKFRSDLLQLLAMVPDQELRTKYYKINLLLFFLIVFVATIKVLVASHVLLGISIYMFPFVAFIAFVGGVFAYMVWNFRGNMYRIIALLGGAGLLKSLSNFEAWSSYSTIESTIELLLGYLPVILIIILSYCISVKVFPYYGFWGMLQEKKMNL